jgi:hypothetical protein
MVVGLHIARVGIFNVDGLGNVLSNDSTSIKQRLMADMKHLVIEDDTISNTSGNPTVEEYLKLEADDNYVLSHIDQSTIITYLRNASGGFPAP